MDWFLLLLVRVQTLLHERQRLSHDKCLIERFQRNVLQHLLAYRCVQGEWLLEHAEAVEALSEAIVTERVVRPH